MNFIVLYLTLLASPFQEDSTAVTQLLSDAKKLHQESQFEEALMLLQEFISTNDLSKNPHGLGKIYLRYGFVYGTLHKPELALNYYKNAIDLGNLHDILELKAEGNLGVGAVFQIKKKYDSSLYYYSKSLPLLRNANDSVNIEGLYANIGYMLYEQGKKDSAKTYLENSLKNRLELNDITGVIGSLNNLGNVYYSSGKFDEAKEYYQKSIDIAKENGITIGLYNSQKGLAEVAYQKKEYSKAIELFFVYDSMATKFLHEDYSDKILELETKYRTAEIERDNALQQVQLESQEQRMIYLYFLAGLLILSTIGIYFYNEQRKKVIRALAFQKEQENAKQIEDLLSQQELKSAYAMLHGQEKAHKRIAEELHDNLGSILVTLNMFADTLQKKTDPEALKKLALKISEAAQTATEATRKISHSLHSGVLKHFGLATAIEELVDALKESGAIEVSSYVQIHDQLDSEISLNIYRILQELINNTLKHAKASKITIEINQIKDNLNLIYEDNGTGFDVDEKIEGIGLQNIKSRIDRMDGTFTLESKIQKGAVFIVDIPVL